MGGSPTFLDYSNSKELEFGCERPMSIASCGLADIELSAAKNFGAKAARKDALSICEKEQATKESALRENSGLGRRHSRSANAEPIDFLLTAMRLTSPFRNGSQASRTTLISWFSQTNRSRNNLTIHKLFGVFISCLICLFPELSFSLMPEALFLAIGLPRLLPQLIGALPDFFSIGSAVNSTH